MRLDDDATRRAKRRARYEQAAIDEARASDRKADRVWLVAVVAILALGVSVAAMLRWAS